MYSSTKTVTEQLHIITILRSEEYADETRTARRFSTGSETPPTYPVVNNSSLKRLTTILAVVGFVVSGTLRKSKAKCCSPISIVASIQARSCELTLRRHKSIEDQIFFLS